MFVGGGVVVFKTQGRHAACVCGRCLEVILILGEDFDSMGGKQRLAHFDSSKGVYNAATLKATIPAQSLGHLSRPNLQTLVSRCLDVDTVSSAMRRHDAWGPLPPAERQRMCEKVLLACLVCMSAAVLNLVHSWCVRLLACISMLA